MWKQRLVVEWINVKTKASTSTVVVEQITEKTKIQCWTDHYGKKGWRSDNIGQVIVRSKFAWMLDRSLWTQSQRLHGCWTDHCELKGCMGVGHIVKTKAGLWLLNRSVWKQSLNIDRSLWKQSLVAEWNSVKTKAGCWTTAGCWIDQCENNGWLLSGSMTMWKQRFLTLSRSLWKHHHQIIHCCWMCHCGNKVWLVNRFIEWLVGRFFLNLFCCSLCLQTQHWSGCSCSGEGSVTLSRWGEQVNAMPSSKSDMNYYVVLGVERSSSERDVKKAWVTLP